MTGQELGKLQPVPLQQVRIAGGFWGMRQTINRTVTLPIEYEQAKKTGRIDAWRLEWKPGQPDPPHHFWDSDVAKWIEAAAYSLAVHPDPELEKLVDDVIELIAAAQQPDGYLNIHFTVVEPQNRWTNLRDMHELYCAGHLTEAAVAYYEATGKRKLLDVLCRYVDHIEALFGPRPGQRRGYPGHEEIELALVKLYRVTGERRYLDLARFFVDERGQQPHYFTREALARGDDPAKFHGLAYDYNQSHLPVREQTTAEGHAVRAMYLFTGMADVAAETGDVSLAAALETLWRNVTERRMYVTGGIGSAHTGERFTFDYDLPNDLAYAETCAAIGLVFWAQRMLQFGGDSRYADVMERALHNGVLSGVSLDGERFFYANPLDVDPAVHVGRPDLYGRSSVTPERQEWFGCACCPPNIARLLASLGGYAYSIREGEEPGVYVHLFMEGEATVKLAGDKVTLRQQTRYPWEGKVVIQVDVERPTAFSLWLRVPGWCRQATIRVNGEPIDVESALESGYARVQRTWQAGDRVELTLAMPVERVEAHPAVAHDCGCVALQRGPLVYCLEEIDHDVSLHDLLLPAKAPLEAAYEPDLLGGVVVIRGEGLRRDPGAWEGALYRHDRSNLVPTPIVAVPYYAWANRGLGQMLVWIRET